VHFEQITEPELVLHIDRVEKVLYARGNAFNLGD
jgi:hypothetical protein